jgi:hypothetical protein
MPPPYPNTIMSDSHRVRPYTRTGRTSWATQFHPTSFPRESLIGISGSWLDSRPPARILGGVYVVAFWRTGGAGRSDWVACADLVGQRSERRPGGVRGAHRALPAGRQRMPTGWMAISGPSTRTEEFGLCHVRSTNVGECQIFCV